MSFSPYDGCMYPNNQTATRDYQVRFAEASRSFICFSFSLKFKRLHDLVSSSSLTLSKISFSSVRSKKNINENDIKNIAARTIVLSKNNLDVSFDFSAYISKADSTLTDRHDIKSNRCQTHHSTDFVQNMLYELENRTIDVRGGGVHVTLCPHATFPPRLFFGRPYR